MPKSFSHKEAKELVLYYKQLIYKKVILIVVDGMRPDALTMCGHPFLEAMKKESLYTLNARTVMPSVTLPCHMSLFHSVPPERHGVTTNTYSPQVRPVKGLCEVLLAGSKTSAFFILGMSFGTLPVLIRLQCRHL